MFEIQKKFKQFVYEISFDPSIILVFREEDVMSKFCILEEELEFNEGLDHWMELYREELGLYDEMVEKYIESYEKAGTMEKVLEEYIGICTQILENVSEKLYKKLHLL